MGHCLCKLFDNCTHKYNVHAASETAASLLLANLSVQKTCTIPSEDVKQTQKIYKQKAQMPRNIKYILCLLQQNQKERRSRETPIGDAQGNKPD